MTQFSAKAGIPYAELTDAPNMQTYAQGLSAVLDNQVIAKYATVSDRNTANPSPASGDVCYCADTDWLYIFSSLKLAWISIFPQTVYKPTQTSRTSTIVSTADPHLTFAVEASSTYVWSAGLLYSFAAAGPGFRDTMQFPSGGNVSIVSTSISTSASTFNGTDATGNWVSTRLGNSPWTMVGGDGVGSGREYPHFMEGVLTTTTAGTFNVAWAQDNSSGSATQLNAGSFLTLQKIA